VIVWKRKTVASGGRRQSRTFKSQAAPSLDVSASSSLGKVVEPYGHRDVLFARNLGSAARRDVDFADNLLQ